jgi:hypothetical protein
MHWIQLTSKIPTLILALAAVLVALALVLTSYMLWERRRALRAIKSFLNAIQTIRPPAREDRNWGISLQRLEELRTAFKSLKGVPRTWGDAIDDELEMYTSPEGRDGWFLTRPAREIATEESILERFYHSGFHQAVPSILTGLGLLSTFIAILIALWSVSYDETNATKPFTGMQDLINGLAGKFITSVIALILGVTFTFIEKKVCERRLAEAYEAVVRTITQLCPTISPTRVLFDIQRLAVKQATSLSNIGSEVVDRFVSAFQTDISPTLAQGVSTEMAGRLQDEFRPTMQRMGDTLSQLSDSIARLETQKQESVTNELKNLLVVLEQSLTSTLNQMGIQFQQALTGAAQSEFGNVKDTLEGTGQMLREMNVQFTMLQGALQTVIQKAEQSTAEQVDAGRRQTAAMTELMEGLMIQLKDSTSQNVQNVSQQLMVVVDDLSKRINKLSESMVDAIGRAAGQSQEVANKVVDNASEWSSATMKRLEALLEAIQHRGEDFNTASHTLMTAHGALKGTIDQNNSALSALAEASRNVQAYSSALAGQTVALAQQNEQNVRIVTLNKESIVSLTASAAEQRQLLSQYRAVFQEYQGVFDGLDKSIAAVLTTIQDGMQNYTQSVEGNFQQILTVCNSTVPQIAAALQTQVGELEDKLEELTSVLDKGITRFNAASAK